ncbi:uncharacterized protein LOC132630671 [Lycium barbarum]|uniref:uncharacterized protein LOC132630671 n=1 Tax=Lycium barbarum TaxID=112863 RepID=UPI00293E03B4|nr:uncharacterized protein LOC132630671 [Lycium barbarum]
MALAELKKYLSSPPLLHTPKANEQLYLYLAVSEIAVSGVLVREEEGTSSKIWTLYTDGASNIKGSGLGIVLKPPSSDIIKQSIRFTILTNNEAEYEAMVAGLELAKGLGAEIIEAKCDSLLVVNQVTGTFEVKDDRMRRYREKLQVVLRRFKEWTLEHVPQDQNNKVDALANLGSSGESDRFNSGDVVQLMRSVIETGHA